MIHQAGTLLSDQAGTTSGPWVKVKGWVVGLTSVLVVIPALINAGFDIYSAALNVPKTESERINAELFRHYFNKEPLVTMPVPITTDRGTTTMKLSVYQAGDIYIEYGDYTRWFPIPVRKQASFSLVSNAYAQPSLPKQGEGAYSQTDRIEDNKIVRERIYSNGVKETIIINRNTGKIENKTISQIAKQSPELPKRPEVKILTSPPIDIRR